MRVRPLHFALLLVSVAFGAYVYNYPPITTTPVPNEGSVCLDYENESMSTLDVDLIHQMTENYRANQWTFINTNPRSKTKNDAYSIWFDIETLKKFLYHIEKTTKDRDESVRNTQLGVRIYYAAYPETEAMNKFPDLSPTEANPEIADYASLHTLIMIPTITTPDGAMLDYNPLDPETYKSGLSKIEKYDKNNPSSIPNYTAALSGVMTDARRTGARNHGLLYPPTGANTALGF